ncbi:MAG: hypothetical protein KIT14_19225 [bacterium]|nr:hypothetical protein [bacterium]
MDLAGYWSGPWPAEDAGPRRTATVARGLALRPGERLVAAASADVLGGVMPILRTPDELFVLVQALGNPQAQVLLLDPETLAPRAPARDLDAGPWWPGGIAAHANGDVYVTCGRWCHRLGPDLSLRASRELPQDRPYNSFVVLPDGCLVMKDLVRDGSPSRLMVLEPERLGPVAPETAVPEGSIARLGADAATVYVVGDHTAFRFHWDAAAGRLRLDDAWRVPYRQFTDQSFGWDPVVAGGQVWFMDNGDHRYAGTMRDAGVAEGPLHLVRAAVDSGDFELVPVCGVPRGAITNPPLYDPARRIAIAFDSANAVLAAFRFADRLEPLWSQPLDVASHLVLGADTGELVVNDHRDGEDHVVVVDVETGAERGRVATGSPVQSVVFPAMGARRDLYYCSFARLVRVGVG